MQSYLPVLVSFLIIAATVAVALGLSAIIGPRPPRNKEKDRPFECGRVPFQEPGGRFPVHYYLVAIIFIVFDIEVIFLYPWIAAYGPVGSIGFLAAMLFILILTLGLVYEWLRGGLEWH